MFFVAQPPQSQDFLPVEIQAISWSQDKRRSLGQERALRCRGFDSRRLWLAVPWETQGMRNVLTGNTGPTEQLSPAGHQSCRFSDKVESLQLLHLPLCVRAFSINPDQAGDSRAVSYSGVDHCLSLSVQDSGSCCWPNLLFSWHCCDCNDWLSQWNERVWIQHGTSVQAGSHNLVLGGMALLETEGHLLWV